MKALLTSGVALAATLAIAACGGSGGAETGTAGGAAAAKGSGTTVSTQRVGGTGTVLVDSAGLALYAPDQEKGGRIMCTGSCTTIWKPLTIASGKPSGAGNLGTLERPDGKLQVTAGGRPLYTFAEDQPGKVTGNGVKDDFGGKAFTWHVITAKGAPATSGSSSGGGSKSGGGYSYGSGY